MKKISMVIAVSIMLGLSACSSMTTDNSNEQEQSIAEADHTNDTEQSLVAEETLSANDSHQYIEMDEMWDDDLSISCNIIIPAGFSGNTAEVPIIQKYKFLRENVEPYLWGTRDTKEVYEDNSPYHDPDGDYRETIFRGIDGSFLSLGGPYLVYSTNLAGAIDRCISLADWSYNLNHYKEKDLSFKDHQSAAEEIIRFFDGTFGISLSNKYSYTALDYPTLQKEYDICNDEGEPIEELSREWSEDDECYRFVFCQDYNEIQVYADGYGALTESGYSQFGDSEVIILYGKDGFVSLILSNLYVPTGEVKKEKIISIEELKELIIKKFSLLIHGKLTIQSITMNYIPVRTGDFEISLRPCYVIDLYHEETEAMSGYHETILFDAVDGKELY